MRWERMTKLRKHEDCASSSNFPCSLTRNITSHSMKTWLFIAYCQCERLLHYQFSLLHLYISLSKLGRMYILNLGVTGVIARVRWWSKTHRSTYHASKNGRRRFNAPKRILVELVTLTALSFCFSFSGFVADATGSYKPAFWLAGSFCIAAAASISLGSLCTKTPQQSDKPREAESDALVVTEKLSVVWFDHFGWNEELRELAPSKASQIFCDSVHQRWASLYYQEYYEVEPELQEIIYCCHIFALLLPQIIMAAACPLIILRDVFIQTAVGHWPQHVGMGRNYLGSFGGTQDTRKDKQNCTITTILRLFVQLGVQQL